MGISYAEAERCGIAHLHPDHPDNREDTDMRRRKATAFTLDADPKAKKPKSKYHATPTVYQGVRYASKAESVRAEVLDDMRSRGLIRFWLGQPTFRLGCPENVYRADFLVVGLAGAHVEDVKGVETPKFRKDKRLWAKYGPCSLNVIRNGKVIEVINPEEIKMQGGEIDVDDDL